MDVGAARAPAFARPMASGGVALPAAGPSVSDSDPMRRGKHGPARGRSARDDPGRPSAISRRSAPVAVNRWVMVAGICCESLPRSGSQPPLSRREVRPRARRWIPASAGMTPPRSVPSSRGSGNPRGPRRLGISMQVRLRAPSWERGHPARSGPEARHCPCGRDARAPGKTRPATGSPFIRRGGQSHHARFEPVDGMREHCGHRRRTQRWLLDAMRPLRATRRRRPFREPHRAGPRRSPAPDAGADSPPGPV